MTLLLASALGFFIQTYAQTKASPARTALILASEPAFAGMFAYLLKGESLTAFGWVGAAADHGSDRDRRGPALPAPSEAPPRALGERSRANICSILRWASSSSSFVARTFNTPHFRGIEFIEVESKSIINNVPGNYLPFNWTINPYRGCSSCVLLLPSLARRQS